MSVDMTESIDFGTDLTEEEMDEILLSEEEDYYFYDGKKYSTIQDEKVMENYYFFDETGKFISRLSRPILSKLLPIPPSDDPIVYESTPDDYVPFQWRTKNDHDYYSDEDDVVIIGSILEQKTVAPSQVDEGVFDLLKPSRKFGTM
jgi:hypothetical protein